MKFYNVLFDFGDTLSYPKSDGTWHIYEWVPGLLRDLFFRGYRLGIVSNTSRYQDSHWVKNQLEENKCLQYFEATIFSANYAIHKPDLKIFEKIVNFMQIDPKKTIMVGDNKKCDGGSEVIGMKYLYVKPQSDWSKSLYDLLDDPIKNRVFTNVFEYESYEHVIKVPLKHFSNSLSPGDRFIINQNEFIVVEIERNFTKNEALNANGNEFISMKVKLADPIKLF